MAATSRSGTTSTNARRAGVRRPRPLRRQFVVGQQQSLAGRPDRVIDSIEGLESGRALRRRTRLAAAGWARDCSIAGFPFSISSSTSATPRTGASSPDYLSRKAIRLCVSEEVADAVRGAGGVGPIVVIPNGVDVPIVESSAAGPRDGRSAHRRLEATVLAMQASRRLCRAGADDRSADRARAA